MMSRSIGINKEYIDIIVSDSVTYVFGAAVGL
jgi:hypothetical protein